VKRKQPAAKVIFVESMECLLRRADRRRSPSGARLVALEYLFGHNAHFLDQMRNPGSRTNYVAFHRC
jgi:hypothetical protein